MRVRASTARSLTLIVSSLMIRYVSDCVFLCSLCVFVFFVCFCVLYVYFVLCGVHAFPRISNLLYSGCLSSYAFKALSVVVLLLTYKPPLKMG